MPLTLQGYVKWFVVILWYSNLWLHLHCDGFAIVFMCRSVGLTNGSYPYLVCIVPWCIPFHIWFMFCIITSMCVLTCVTGLHCIVDVFPLVISCMYCFMVCIWFKQHGMHCIFADFIHASWHGFWLGLYHGLCLLMILFILWSDHDLGDCSMMLCMTCFALCFAKLL